MLQINEAKVDQYYWSESLILQARASLVGLLASQARSCSRSNAGLAGVILWPLVAQIRLSTYRQGFDEEQVGYADDESFAFCWADFKMRVNH